MTPPLTAQQRALREAVRALLETPQVRRVRDQHAAAAPGQEIDVRPVHRLLGAHGRLAVSWPERYGGGGRSAVEAAIVHQEIVRCGLPDLPYVVSICYVGDFVLTAGSEALRERYLPRLARGDVGACTLYSEPDAGSDLGSLTSRAEPVSGGWRLYGTKVHAQGTRYADYGLVAARIGERGAAEYDGITLFWVPLNAPGVHVEQVPGISDHPFSRVVLDGVEVPADHVVGPAGQGWQLLNEALTLERTGFEAHLKMRAWLDAVAERAGRAGLLGDGALADRLVDLDTRIEAGGTLAWEMVGKQARREIDDVGSAMSKWYNTELGRPIAQLALDVEGLAGTLTGRYPDAPLVGRAELFHREAPGLTLSAGTSEIMLYTISTGHLRVHAEDGEPGALDDPHAKFRRRVAGFLASPGVDFSTLSKANMVRLTLPEAAGGLGGRLGESLVAAEEMGAVLLRGPWAATVSLAEVLAADGRDGAHWTLVCDVAAGERAVAAAATDGTGGAGVAVELVDAPSGPRITGTAAFVPCADEADLLLVPAAAPDGARFVLVDRAAPGVRTERLADVSEAGAARVTFDGAVVRPDGVLWRCDAPQGRQLLARLRLRQAGYLLGLARGAWEMALARTRRRKQFGTAVAAFQHNSFQLAALAARLHAARRLLHLRAAGEDGAGPAHRPAAAVLALITDLARDATAIALHLHGAVGLTDSAQIQRYHRQVAVEGVVFGAPQRLRALASPFATENPRSS